MKLRNSILLKALFAISAWIMASPCQAKYLDADMTWHVYLDAGEQPRTLMDIRVTGDSVINGTKYKIVANTPVREDGDRIYCYVHDPLEKREHEVLIYDFGMKPGDKIRILVDPRSGDAQTYYVTVASVDTTYLYDGRMARQINYDGYRASDLEYIGHVHGGIALPFIQFDEFDYYYVCLSAGEKLLHETYRGACDDLVSETLSTGINNEKAKTALRIEDGMLYIFCNGIKYDVMGCCAR